MSPSFEESANRRSAYGKRGLNPHWYLDTSVFETEATHFFAEAWSLVGYEQDLPTVGSFMCRNFSGVPIVLLRDEEHRIRAFQNVCRHRGTQLCTEDSGQLKSSLVCPYHGWKYDLDGRLAAAPTMKTVGEFDPGDYGLIEHEARVWHSMIFMTTSSDPPQLTLEPLSDVAADYQLDQFQKIHSINYEVAANWKFIFQNFNECYHCPSVHPQLTPFADFRDAENDFEAGALLGGPMRIRESASTISNDGQLCGALPTRSGTEAPAYARYYTVFPNLFISFFPDYVMVHALRPIDHRRTAIQCDFLYHQDTIASDDFAPEKAYEFWDLTNRQDWEMCERVQVGMSTPGFQPSPYSDLESLLAAFDDHYLEQMKRLEQ